MITLKEKTGFYLVKRPLVITDMRGKLFYDSEDGLRYNPNWKVNKINLPEGSFKIAKGSIRKLSRPVDYPLPSLPMPERFHSSPYNFSIKVKTNPNKCTIDWVDRSITFDPYILTLSLPEITFILFHEYGHRLYGTEEYADLYSARKMLEEGYNPTQIGLSPLRTLSDRQQKRKEFVIDNLVNCYR